jgi:hypothetical protein
MADENPFVYGEIVPAAAFVDREAELDRLVSDLGDCQKIFLISPRRYGKSSLIRQALGTLGRRRVATLEFTVSSFSSYVAFLEGYTRALAGLDTRSERARSWLRDLFTSVKPELRLEAAPDSAGLFSFPTVRTQRVRRSRGSSPCPGGSPAGSGAVSRSRSTSFRPSAATAGQRRGGRRAAVRQQRQVGYVFAGSSPVSWSR